MRGDSVRRELSFSYGFIVGARSTGVEDWLCEDRWEALGLCRGTSVGDIRRAFQEKARRYRPDRF